MTLASNTLHTPSKIDGRAVGPMEASVLELEENGKDPRLAFGRRPDSGLRELISDSFGLFSFTTESIEDYLPHLDVKGKRCLTVASSGDQAIALLMAGAAEVVTFDVIEAAGEITELKMNALAHLEWEGREQFGYELWERVLSPRGFSQICDRAPNGMFHRDYSPARLAVYGLPVGQATYILRQHQIYGYTAYLANDEAFNNARWAVTEALSAGRVSFVRADVRDLPYINLGDFDVIVLSNILGAMFRETVYRKIFGGTSRKADHSQVNERHAHALMSSVIWPVAGMLRDGGTMMASYHYGCDPIVKLRDTCRFCGDLKPECQCDRPDPFSETETRRELFEPPRGFAVEEYGWPTVHHELSGEDVAVFIRKVVNMPDGS